ncbi:hypothetical protein KC19_4G128900, partial [Ceratodon purpureus]
QEQKREVLQQNPSLPNTIIQSHLTVHDQIRKPQKLIRTHLSHSPETLESKRTRILPSNTDISPLKCRANEKLSKRRLQKFNKKNSTRTPGLPSITLSYRSL